MVTQTEPRREDACMITADGVTYCIDPLEATLQIIGKRWALLVIGILGNRESTRFTDARRTIPGISPRALSSVLQELQAHGLAARTVDPEQSPPAVSYSLTEAGHSLRSALLPLMEWAESNVAGASSP